MVRLRRRGWRVNLRPLADLRNLVWLPLGALLLYSLVRTLAWVAWALAQAPQATPSLHLAAAEAARQAARERLQQQQQRQQHLQQQQHQDGDL